MTPFLPRQAWYTALILALLAPILLSIGVPAIGRMWTGLSFVWFMIGLLAVFIVLSWALSRMAFAPLDTSAETVAEPDA